MSQDSIAYIVEALKAARIKKGLTQRALSIKTGVPQSHISKIENGAVDLYASSLVEISRVLDLELMLVPRQLVASFKALIRSRHSDSPEQTPLYTLDQEDDDG